MKNELSSSPASRRDFLKAGSAAALGGAMALSLAPRDVHAAGDDVLKVGLIGCGGRGTGAAVDALSADPQTRLVAMGDAFADRLQGSLDALQKHKEVGARVDVAADRRFVGFDAYKQVIESGVDVVLLCTPPHFRPAHFEAAVAKGLHVFAEKPVAVDSTGVRRVLAAAKQAAEKKLAVVSGLCWRYDPAMIATVDKIKQGAIGDVLVVESNYLTSQLWTQPRRESWSDMEFQMRNWLYYTWLSGDHIAEQHVHSLDKAAWVFGDKYPVAAISSGGRIQRTEPIYGHIYDHFATIYEFENGGRCFSHCRQMDDCAGDVSDRVYGTTGTANLMKFEVSGKDDKWRYRGEKKSMYKAEHEALFKSIRAGEPINNGEYMCHSTLMAIMGRMAAYTGKRVTWQQALESEEDLSPPKYDWISLPVPPVAIPGRAVAKVAQPTASAVSG